MRKANQKGFMAITTTMILVVILLVVATSLSFSGFFTRYNILDTELKKVSNALAEACVDQALLKIAANDTLTFPIEEIVGDDMKCNILSITGSTEKTIITESHFKEYYTYLKIKADSSDLKIKYWEESGVVPSS